MKTVKVGFLGFGTVGSGAYALLQKNHDAIVERTGINVEVTKVLVRHIPEHPQVSSHTKFVTDVKDILDDPEISIVVEMMGGTEFAYSCIETAMRHHKNVVTANKDLLALRGKELHELAVEMGVDFRYEAAVLGGIPIIRPLYTSLEGDTITDMLGIMNGTTNYMLTKMTEENMSYSEVLQEAQALGYAEADPTSDVEGYDAARKLVILSSIAYNEHFTFDDVAIQGITHIDTRDIEEAKSMGYIIKLIGRSRILDGKYGLSVYPMLIHKDHPLASVRGSYNALYIKGEGIGDAMFYGQGAGSLPTGNSIVSDILDIGVNIDQDVTGRKVLYLKKERHIRSAGTCVAPYYFRLSVHNKTGVLAKIATILSEQDISIRTVWQKIESDDSATLIIITEPTQRQCVEEAIEKFNGDDCVIAVQNYIAVLE